MSAASRAPCARTARTATAAARPSPVRRRAALTAGAAAAALLVSACGSGGTSGGGGNTNFVTGTDGIATVAKGERTAAPDLSGKTIDGKTLDVADYKGKVVVLNVWGSWCNPCRAEAKYFAKVSKAYAGKGVQFVGINTRDTSTGAALAFEKDCGHHLPQPLRPDRQADAALREGHAQPAGDPLHPHPRPGREDRGPLAVRAQRGTAAEDAQARRRGEVT